MDEIRTERLRMRNPVPDDVDGYLAFVSDYEVVKWTSSWPHPADREFTVSRCRQVDPDKGFVGPVFLGDEQIGGMGIVNGEMGYFFARKHWGHGYASEIGRAVVARAFQIFDYQQITAEVLVGNPGSSRVLEKLGFEESGFCRCLSVAQGKEFDALKYRLSRTKWACENPIQIETQRLTIRSISARDLTQFHAIAARHQVSRMVHSIPHPLTLDQARDWLEGRGFDGRLGFCLGVYLKDGTLIGALGIGSEPASTTYFFDPDHWGRGYASEAMRGFLVAVFDRFNPIDLQAGASVYNPASQRVLTKLGFTMTGRIMHQPSVRLEPDRLILYRLTRTQFEASR